MTATLNDDMTSIDEHIAKTHRMHAAIYAMGGLLAAHAGDGVSLPTAEKAAKMATEYADALLAELAK